MNSAISGAAALTFFVTAFSATAETSTTAAADAAAYLGPQSLVRVEGARRLNLVCKGAGSPVVVFESGAGGGASDWRKVQPEVSGTTTACSYDRAGYGFSDAPSTNSDANAAVTDLHRLLRRAKLRGPVVLVAHSVGGLYAELFASRYPADVAGMVLVDPTGRQDFQLVKKIITDDEAQKQRAAYLKRMDSYSQCLEAAQRGEAPVSPGQACAPPTVENSELEKVLEDQFSQPKRWMAFKSEMENFYPTAHPLGVDSATTLQVKARPFRLGSKPLVLLLTPGRVPAGPRGEWLREASSNAAQQLVQASTRGKIINVEARHYIQLDHPEVVIKAIEDVVTSVRAGS